MEHLDFEIDKLTHSIENALTGENFPTEVFPLIKEDLKQVAKKNGWKFNWEMEFANSNKEVFKLVLLHEPKIIQGLVCFSIMPDHLFMDLIESSPFNVGKAKQYFGVAGNLVAFCCKRSFEIGFDGEMAFTAKTQLIEHYAKTLNAELFAKQRMIIKTIAAIKLVEKYFPDFFNHK